MGHDVEDVAGQLDVAQDVGDLLGVDASLLPPALDQRVPLAGIDALHLGRLDGDRAESELDNSFWVVVTFPH